MVSNPLTSSPTDVLVADKSLPKPLQQAYNLDLKAKEEAAGLANLKEQEDLYGKTKMAEATPGILQKYAEEREPAEKRDLLEQKVKEQGAPFIPNERTAGDLGLIFTLTNILGFGIGRGAKGNAQAALSAQNGMLEGWQKGDMDAYKKQKDIFEENQKALAKEVEGLRDELARAEKTASVDKEKAVAEVQMAIAKHGADTVGEYLKTHPLSKAVELLDSYVGMMNKSQELIYKQQEIGLQRERLDFEKAKAGGKVDDLSQYLDSKGIHIADKADKKAVSTAVSSMAELKDLKSEVQNNPELVGRQGQIRQFTERYLDSFKTGKPFDESSVPAADQPALLFSKKYASMLTRYEQGLAGSGRAANTVSFQNRYNNLLSQNQFDPASMSQLFDDMQLEMARTAGKASPKLTYQLMNDMAEDVRGRITPANISTPQAGKAPQKAIDYLKDNVAAHPELKEQFKAKYGYLPEGM
jgi:hypothetical protein